jgi:ubiquitin carboxyl-terminal hydrolase 4/11/15
LIRRKILEKLATFTTRPDLIEEDEEANESVGESSVDPDMVLTTTSDSSSESKVVASSIDGEDELVDVKMKESNGVRESVEKEMPKSSEADQTT